MILLTSGASKPIAKATVANISLTLPSTWVNELIMFYRTSNDVHASYLSHVRKRDCFPGCGVPTNKAPLSFNLSTVYSYI